MTQEELKKKIKQIRAENRAAVERSEARSREYDREAPIRTITTELAFRKLRESARRP